MALGVAIYPLFAKASLFDSILGSPASADSGEDFKKNSQNMDLLQANVSFLSVSQEKGLKRSEETLDLDNNILTSNNALLPVANPATLNGIGGYEYSEEDISIYVVHKGDTIDTVAKLFDVSADTIYSANNMKKGDKLKEGDVLLVLPFSGVEHTVAKGETLKGIAGKYKVDLSDILNANDIDESAKLAVGEKLMIPGGSISSTVTTKSGATVKSSGGASYNVPLVAGYFKNPVPGAVKSRGIKPGHKGVDLAAPTGTPIHAAAGGTVVIARTGWNGGYGTYVVIQHPDGSQALYAHMSKLGTSAGSQVSQGDIIGNVGSTGHSTGPHLHFQTFKIKNPF